MKFFSEYLSLFFITLSSFLVSAAETKNATFNPWQMDGKEAARLGVTFPWYNPGAKPHEIWYDPSDANVATKVDYFTKFFDTECYIYNSNGREFKACYKPKIMGFKWGEIISISDSITCNVGVTCKLRVNRFYTYSPRHDWEAALPSQHWQTVINKIQPNFASLQGLSPSSIFTKEVHGPGRFIMNFKPLLWYVRMQAVVTDQYTGHVNTIYVTMKLPIVAGQSRLNGVYSFEKVFLKAE